MSERELRVLRAPAPELRAATADEPAVLEGYAAVFNSYSRNLGGFVEVVDPGAFTDTIAQDGRDILGLVNHDPNWLLGSTMSRTMELTVDAVGEKYRILLDESDPDAQRAMAKVRTGKMRGSSFSFRTIKDEWGTTEQGFPLRRLLVVEQFDGGPVSMAAYPGTEADGAAVALRSLASFVNEPVDRVVAAARSNTLAQLLGGAPAAESPAAPSFPLRSQWSARFGVRPPVGS